MARIDGVTLLLFVGWVLVLVGSLKIASYFIRDRPWWCALGGHPQEIEGIGWSECPCGETRTTWSC